MKIIDLLNKIANGEELPDKIFYDGNDYKLVEYGETTKLYQCLSEPYELFNINTDRLNEEVVILIDIKIPEKIDQNDKEWHYLHNTKKTTEEVADNLEHLRQKVNEIIDYLEDKQC